jgi:mRNA interferase HigB
MRVISRKRLKEAVLRHGNVEASLDAWYRIAKNAVWKSIEDVRKTYPSADPVGPYTVFNVKGNRYRLVVKIEYRFGLVFIKEVLTHAEYDKGEWKR